MKNCNQIREWLSLYLDNELHENERKQVVKHLENCTECKNELEYLKDIVDAINDIEEINLPQDYEKKLHDRLIFESKIIKQNKWKSFSSVFKWCSTVAAMLIILVFAFNENPFNNLLDKSKVAYINDAKLNQTNGNQNLEVALAPESKEKDFSVRSNDVYNDLNENNNSDIILQTNNYDSADKNVRTDDSIIINEKVEDNSINIPETVQDDTMIRLANIGESEEDSNTDESSIDVKDDSEIMSFKSSEPVEDTEIQILEMQDPVEKTVEEKVFVTMVTENSSVISSDLISIVQANSGEIQEIALLSSLKKSIDSSERYFNIKINSTEFEKIINFAKDNGILVENTYAENGESKIITITLRMVEKEFLRNR